MWTSGAQFMLEGAPMTGIESTIAPDPGGSVHVTRQGRGLGDFAVGDGCERRLGPSRGPCVPASTVTTRTEGYKQDGAVVLSFQRNSLVPSRKQEET
jgi:hypothetical protein